MLITRILIGILCVATIPLYAAKRLTRTQYMKDLDKMLGVQSLAMTPEKMQMPMGVDPAVPCSWSSGYCLRDVPSEGRTWTPGRKMVIERTHDAGFVYLPGHPAIANSTTTGQVDRRGNIYATTTTTETPAVEDGGFYVHWRNIFYLDASGKIYKWEVQQCVSHSFTLSDDTVQYGAPGYTPRTPWEVVAARELQQDKKGTPKIVTIQKPTSSWFLR